MGGFLQHLEAFSGLMARCLGSGMEPARALELCGSRSAWRPLRKWSDDGRVQILEGESLGDAVQAGGSPFPRFYTATVRCGEQAGRLSEAFDDLAEHCRRLLPMARGVRELWLYPAIIFSFGWLVRAAMLAWFGEGYRIGYMVRREIMPCVLVALVLYVLRGWRPMRRPWYGLKLNMRIVRAVELAWATNLFFRNLSLTTGMGNTSVVHMLTMACDGIANDVIRDDFMRARRLLAEGQSWEGRLGPVQASCAAVPRGPRRRCSVAECRDRAKHMTIPASGRLLLRRVTRKRPPQHLLRRDGPDSALKRKHSRQNVRSAPKSGQDLGIIAASEAANGKSRITEDLPTSGEHGCGQAAPLSRQPSGVITMTRAILSLATLLGIMLVAGCDRTPADPRLEGRVVSHVDSYGSGTGGQRNLEREGSMDSGFDYGDPAKVDWTSNIEWCFLRHDGGSDVYRVEWTFKPKNGTGRTQTTEVSFDGKHSVRAFENKWQTISLDPGLLQWNSQEEFPISVIPAETATRPSHVEGGGR